jgi:hypothetical protein
MEEFLDLSLLVKQLALAFGIAMLAGNLYALYKHRKGDKPKGEEGEFRAGRAAWLISVGLLISIWGGVSLLA